MMTHHNQVSSTARRTGRLDCAYLIARGKIGSEEKEDNPSVSIREPKQDVYFRPDLEFWT